MPIRIKTNKLISRKTNRKYRRTKIQDGGGLKSVLKKSKSFFVKTRKPIKQMNISRPELNLERSAHSEILKGLIQQQKTTDRFNLKKEFIESHKKKHPTQTNTTLKQQYNKALTQAKSAGNQKQMVDLRKILGLLSKLSPPAKELPAYAPPTNAPPAYELHRPANTPTGNKTPPLRPAMPPAGVGMPPPRPSRPPAAQPAAPPPAGVIIPPPRPSRPPVDYKLPRRPAPPPPPQKKNSGLILAGTPETRAELEYKPTIEIVKEPLNSIKQAIAEEQARQAALVESSA